MPQFAGVNYLSHLPYRAGIDECVIDDQHELAPFGLIDQFACLQRRLRHRLLEPEMLPRLQCRHAKFEMRVDWRRDRDGIDRWIAEDFLEVGRRLGCRITAANDVELRLVEIDDRSNAGALHFREIPDEVWTPVTVTDDADIDHCVG